MSAPGPATTFPIDVVREDFPILRTMMRGKPLVYLDSGATSLKPQAVIDAEVDYLTRLSANIHRGVYQLSEEATTRYDAAREKLKAFVNCGSEGEVVFTKGATEGNNLVAFGWGRRNLRAGDEIVVTELEHHANLIPWQRVAAETGAVLRFVPLSEAGEVTVEAVETVMSDRTRVVTMTGMSNVTGHMPPIERISEVAHRRGAIVAIDGAQLVSHHAVDVQKMGCDFLAWSGHKMCGPTGVGALYGRRELFESTDPLLYGGDMIVRVTRDTATFKGAPDKFETGTPNIAGVLGFGAAADYLTAIGMDAVEAHEHALLEYAVERIASVPEVELYGPAAAGASAAAGAAGEPGGARVRVPSSGGIISFNLGDLHPHDVGSVLDGEGVAVRTGFHCAQPLMKVLKVPGTVRVSLYLYNTFGDIDRLVDGLHKVREVFA